jgi:hypothetical protein
MFISRTPGVATAKLCARSALRALWMVGLVSGAAESENQITLTWYDNSNNETGFKIERTLPGLAFTQIATVGADVWAYTDMTVLPSTAYRYRIRATNASGDSAYTNVITANATVIYSGTIGPDPFVGVFNTKYRSGTLYMALSSTGEALIVPLSIDAEGRFNVVVHSGATTSRLGTMPGFETPPTAAAEGSRTFRGRIFDGALNGTLDELGRSFTATIRSAAGPTESLAGVYMAGTILSASGTTYLIVDAQGKGYVLSVNSTSVTAGSGTISSSGAFSIQTPQATIEGDVNGDTKLLRGTVQLANRPPADILGIEVNSNRTDRLINLSSRVRVGLNGGMQPLISGFVVAGANSKRMLLRAIGPGLASFGVQDALRNPQLQLFDQLGRVIAQNDDWGNGVDISAVGDRVGAFRLAPNSLDSALLVTLDPGVYTMQIGSTDGEGLALAEIYDATVDPQAASVINISTRGHITTGEGAIMGGFVISGNTPNRVLVRAVGPTLESFGVAGVLNDPVLRVYQNSVMIAQNDNWEAPLPVSASQSAASGAEVAAAAKRVGAFPYATGSRDAAVVVILAPGTYTADVRGATNAAGSGLLEIYQIPND